MEQLKKAGKIIGKMISILSIIFIIYAIWKLGFDFQSIHNWYLFLAVSLVCVIVKCVTVYLSGMAWACWLHFLPGKKLIGGRLSASMPRQISENTFRAM